MQFRRKEAERQREDGRFEDGTGNKQEVVLRLAVDQLTEEMEVAAPSISLIFQFYPPHMTLVLLKGWGRDGCSTDGLFWTVEL